MTIQAIAFRSSQIAFHEKETNNHIKKAQEQLGVTQKGETTEDKALLKTAKTANQKKNTVGINKNPKIGGF